MYVLGEEPISGYLGRRVKNKGLSDCEDEGADDKEGKAEVDEGHAEGTEEIEGGAGDIPEPDATFVELVVDGDVDYREEDEGEDGGKVDYLGSLPVDLCEFGGDGDDVIVEEAVEDHSDCSQGDYDPSVRLLLIGLG